MTITVGWKEYADLPDLGLRRLKVKMDTGARTSALHVARYEVDGDRVALTLLPHRRPTEMETEAELAGWLEVRNSGGQLEPRPVISTVLRLGAEEARVPVTLADRAGMLFRMLIGRKALETLGAVVDVSCKYRLGRRGG